jgi:hypothetical protein
MDPRPLIYGLEKRAKNEVNNLSFEARRVRDENYNDWDRAGKERVCGELRRSAGQGGDAPAVAPRAQVLEFIGQLSPCVVGMESCGGAHYWARAIKQARA